MKNVNKFGLGDWWPRPVHAAAGGLDHLPVDQWPMLAAMWLEAGYDSLSLRRLAGLQSGDPPAGHRIDAGDARRQAGGGFQTRDWLLRSRLGQDHRRRQAASAALDQMPQVLRSIGFDPGPADEEFRSRCQNALDIVQHDLDVTGYGRYQMRARRGHGQYAIMFATLLDGSYWGGGEGMSRNLDGSWLLFNAAESVSATIEEVHEIEWPICAIHGDDPRTRWEPVALIRKVAWWQCTRARHALAPVGQLTADIARTR